MNSMLEGENYMPIDIGHSEVFKKYFTEDPPCCSELTFTNLFIWRHKYNTIWKEHDNCLLIILRPENGNPFGLEPVGNGDKRRALDTLFDTLNNVTSDPIVSRVSEEFVINHTNSSKYDAIPDRDNSDYVYSTGDLASLSGRKYHRKKNHLNKFLKNYNFEFKELNQDLVKSFLSMQENWCQIRECVENPGLLSEDFAIHEALVNFDDLSYKGCAIEVDSEIEAFSLGERLNENTAVIHIEKANPEIPGLYTAINQLSCKHVWSKLEFINREQDLGVEGLRSAKESYHPHHMVNKYILKPI